MKRIERVNLTDQIYEQIVTNIMQGAWAEGDKLPSESELADTMGVSRVSVRAAIQKACAIGLIETKVGEGSFVRKFNMADLFRQWYSLNLIDSDNLDINDCKSILQIGSVFLAIHRNSGIDEGVIQLKHIYGEMEKALKSKDIDKFNESDFAFHKTVCQLSQNKLMSMLYDSVSELLADIIRDKNRHAMLRGTMESLMDYHLQIINCIEKRDFVKFLENERPAIGQII